MKSEELKKHWNNVYNNSSTENLGWYESDHSHTMHLINSAQIGKDSSILVVGAGSTTLIDKLIDDGYDNILATDLSDVALNKLRERLADRKIKYIVDNLAFSEKLFEIDEVDIWIDRAVLHFLTKNSDQEEYFRLIKSKTKRGGYAIIAEFSTEGAEKCAGLPVKRYSAEMLKERMEPDFKLIESFEHTYTNPSGGKRPYIYTLFYKLN